MKGKNIENNRLFDLRFVQNRAQNRTQRPRKPLVPTFKHRFCTPKKSFQILRLKFYSTKTHSRCVVSLKQLTFLHSNMSFWWFSVLSILFEITSFLTANAQTIPTLSPTNAPTKGRNCNTCELDGYDTLYCPLGPNGCNNILKHFCEEFTAISCGYSYCDFPPFYIINQQVSTNIIYNAATNAKVYSMEDGIVIDVETNPDAIDDLGHFVRIQHQLHIKIYLHINRWQYCNLWFFITKY